VIEVDGLLAAGQYCLPLVPVLVQPVASRKLVWTGQWNVFWLVGAEKQLAESFEGSPWGVS
jgi:hypothetical protein